MDKSYDILIIGGGPAGASAAKASAAKGAKVLLIDKKKDPGFPVQCAELITQWIFHHIDLPSRSIVQKIENLITHLPDESCFKMRSPGFMIDRSIFDKELLIQAALKGTQISMATKAIELYPDGVLIERERKKGFINSKIIIGADGTNSIVSKWIGEPSLKKIHTIQAEVVLFEKSLDAEIFFDKLFEGGYAWFFPKGNRANIGIGITSLKFRNLSKLLNQFLGNLKNLGKLPRVEILSKTGGLIPCETRKRIYHNNILLVGDAAGHAHPITGAGIFNAIVGGEIAGRISAEAIQKGDLNHLKNYEIEWEGIFGKALAYGSTKRSFLEDNWNNSEIDFQSLIRSSWIGFKEYYKDRKGTCYGE